MNDLRKDVNEVFARQQGQLGDMSQATNRMLRAATAGRRVNRQLWPSVAGVALVLVAALAVALSVVIRGQHTRNVVISHPTPTPIATPTATPEPTPMSQALAVPSTTPVILFHDPAAYDQIDGVTWDGSAKGRVGGNGTTGFAVLPNPDGTLYATIRDIRDRTGAVVAQLGSNTKGFPWTWADDGRHYCSMVSKSAVPPAGGEPTTLQVTAVGQAPRNVVQVGRVTDQTSAGVAACSIEKDRAVVVQSGGQGLGTAQFWVVQLSTGRILWTRSYSLDGVTTVEIRASRDGQSIAEVKYTCCPTTAGATTIYGPSGAVAGHAIGRIEAFSWDGSLAVQTADLSGPVSVVRWRDGTVLWTGPTNGGYLDALPEPGGQRIAISVLDPSHPQTPQRSVYVVGADGQAVELLTDVMRAVHQ